MEDERPTIKPLSDNDRQILDHIFGQEHEEEPNQAPGEGSVDG